MKFPLGANQVRITPERGAYAEETRPGPPVRIDGYTLGCARMSQPPPHGGEMHPDGDEVLYLIAGGVDVHLEMASGEEIVSLGPGDACIVPRGVWHRVELREPSELIHLTPGPRGEHRPRPSS